MSRGVSASLPRKEDERLLRGRGEFVADIKRPGMLEAAFLRSPVAHARVGEIRVPPHLAGRVFTAGDLAGVAPIRAVSALPGFKVSAQPILAADKVRLVGELVALCLGHSRAAAEDAAAEIAFDYEPLGAVHDMLRARDTDAPLLHEDWGDNVFLEALVDGDPNSVAERAAVTVRREYRTARQCMAPIEGRGLVAEWDGRRDQLILHSACQMPHIVRTGLAECLGIDEGKVRIIAPDVGGGFGYKGLLLAEEVVCAWAAMHLGRPVRWIEDRREQLVANADCREHHYVVTAHANAEGRLLGLDCEAHVDSGAYSAYPFSACLEAAQIGSILPGPYDFEAYRCRTWSVATNKAPILPFRGVARTGVCFAMELTLDAIARELGREPWQVRMANLIRPEQMPFDNITAKHFGLGRLSRMPAPGDGGDRRRGGAGPPDGGGGRRPGASASAARSIASRRRTAPRSMPAGASRWCRGTSNVRPASPPTARWNCASACTATARDWKRRSPRSPTRSWASIRPASTWCMGTQPSPPIRPVPGAHAAP